MYRLDYRLKWNEILLFDFVICHFPSLLIISCIICEAYEILQLERRDSEIYESLNKSSV